MINSGYDTAQICLNGHEINTRVIGSPETNQNFCDKCGEETITKCPSCNSDIRGAHNDSAVEVSTHYTIPNHCHQCGSPFPWISKALEAANELADEINELSQEEKEKLKKSLNDLITEGPETEAATTRFKKIMSKAGPEIGNAFKGILIRIVSETVKKSIWG